MEINITDTKKINTILFDFDGTVMDTNGSIISSWQHTYRELTGAEGNIEKIITTFGEMLKDSMAKAFPNVPVEKSLHIYRSYQKETFADVIELFPGILELLEEVRIRGYKTALVTSRLKNTTEIGLDKFDLYKYFDVIVTAEDVSHHKPHPECINAALNKLDSLPEEVVMLGDTMYDIKCCKNAGVKAVLVEWSVALSGKSIDDFDKEEAPDYIIKKPMELFEYI